MWTSFQKIAVWAKEAVENNADSFPFFSLSKRKYNSWNDRARGWVCASCWVVYFTSWWWQHFNLHNATDPHKFHFLHLRFYVCKRKNSEQCGSMYVYSLGKAPAKSPKVVVAVNLWYTQTCPLPPQAGLHFVLALIKVADPINSEERMSAT